MPTKGPVVGDATTEEKHSGSWHLCFPAAKYTMCVVGAIGFPCAADKRQQGR